MLALLLLVAGLLAPPTVTSLSPASATAGGGAFILTVTGTEFRRNAVVLWNGAERPTTWRSEDRLTAEITAADIASPGVVEVRVLVRGAKGGRSAPATFTVSGGTATTTGSAPTGNPVPAVSAVTPAVAPAGAESFRLFVTGTGFVSGTAVRWNGETRPTTLLSATRLYAVMPASDLAAVGSARVTVFTPSPGGGSSAEQVIRIVHLAPAVSTLSPATAQAGSGDLVVTLTGQNFLRTAQAFWNNLPRATSFGSPTGLRVTVPAADLRSAGTAQLTVVTTVGSSSMRSAPVAFTITSPPPTTATATPQLVVSSFHVGGEADPAWVTAGRAVPLHAVITGVAPTHYRVAENAQFSGADWLPAAGAPSYTFAAATTGARTLWYQVRYGSGTGATQSAVVSDGVEVVPPYSTSGVMPATYGTTSAERVRLECTPGQVMTGIHGAAGAWLDNIGLECAGRKGGFAYTAVYGGLGAPAAFEDGCPLGSAPGAIGLGRSRVWDRFLETPVISCPYTPTGVAAYYETARAEAVAGERETFEHGVHCPSGAFPVGMDVYLGRAPVTGQRGVTALGLLCARLRP